MQARTALLIILSILLTSCDGYRPSRHTRNLTTELDSYISSREMYVARKKSEQEVLLKLSKGTKDPLRQYEIEKRIADGYFSFSFDSTQTHYKRCQQLAKDVLHDRELYNAASISLGHLYTKSGNFMEAYNLLYGQVDTSWISDETKADHLYALYEFGRDLVGDSGMVERLSLPDYARYRERLLELIPAESVRARVLRMHRFMDEGKLAQADSLGRKLAAELSSEEHEWAVLAFEMSTICERMERGAEQLSWLVKSAECDIINAVKDYASLTMVAQLIMKEDVEHSFHYLRIAQEDAIFYNARLRPWQISRFLLQVESAYADRQARNTNIIRISMVLFAFLAIILALLSRFLIQRTRTLSKAREDLERSNEQLASANYTLGQLNRQIAKADKVKERYILEFLDGLSRQVSTVRAEDNRFRLYLKQGKQDQLLKELSISSRAEKARDTFYRSFDNTILGLYPDFVEEFNSLVREDARETPPGGRLTTCLRIFALIRLGVDDSKEIARILDLSVSTVYNHKVAVKNASTVDRDDFEAFVKYKGK